MSDIVELAVIGGGISGIAAAKFYLEVHPTASVVIIERDSAAGGVWSSERVYPGFRSQGGVRVSGFSDTPFNPPADEVDEADLFTASSMAQYLDEYVDNHIYSGRTLRERIRFGTSVTGLLDIGSGWIVTCEKPGDEYEIIADKVIIASGLTSTPTIPDFKGRDTFEKPIVHTLHYGRSKVYERADIIKVAVIGAGKSAADLVYENVKAGREVSWIIRESGKGPGAFVTQKLNTRLFRNAAEVTYSRAGNVMLMPGLQPSNWCEYFVHKTTTGVWLWHKISKTLGDAIISSAEYDDRKGARDSFKLLKPETGGLATDVPSVPAGNIHHLDFWDTVAQNVDVYRADINRLEKGKVVFNSGESIEVDAILCGTGFKDTIPFLTTEQCVQFGLPHTPVEMDKKWYYLEDEAEREIRGRFYTLNTPPTPKPDDHFGDISLTDTPFRLYNCIAPIDPEFAHRIAFVGFSVVSNQFANAEISSIWATAYLDGNVTLPSQEDMKRDIAYKNVYMRLRVPTYGRLGNFFLFDYIPYLDRLLQEVGLKSWRKNWFTEHFRPLVTADFRGLKDEYLEKYGTVGKS